jgi:signal transduction histidine kinase
VRPRRPARIRLRLAVATAALMATSAALALGGAYWWTVETLERRVDASVDGEVAELLRRHDERGPAALAAEIRRRSRAEGVGQVGYYILTESHYEIVEGNLAGWPKGLGPDSEARTLSVESQGPTLHVTRRVRAVTRTLTDGGHLLVARDVTEHAAFERALRFSVMGALALALLLAIAGGLAVSRNLLGRVEGMNETIRRILAGRRGERVVLAGSGDEFDSLAAQFNRLLDENDRLVAKMRSVTNDIAHDLRTPLARMRGHIESALAATGDVEVGQRALGSLLVETNAVLDTFNGLLQIAQIESRAIREQMEPVDLEPVVQGAVDLYQPVADESGIELVPDAGPGLLVHGNRHLIAQALSNLIDNAIKYAPGPGRVDIRTRRRDGRIELSVGDRGPGIPEAERAHVLERGVRLDASRHLPGTGLGLSFVAAVADLHDAKLSLDDHGPGLLVTLAFRA